MGQWSFTRIPCGALLLVAVMTAAAAQSPSIEVRAPAAVLGSGSPVVLLGGGLLGADGWGGVPAALAKTHRVVNVQSLAVQYGLEDRPLPAGYSLVTEVAALRATLDGLAVERADLIGMSHGGVTALLFALGNPHRVRTLTLVEPPAFWMLPNHGHDDPGASQMQQFVGSLRGATITDLHVERFRCLLGECAGGRSPRQAPQWGQWVKYRNSLRALHTIGDYDDDPAKLRTLSVPTLVIHGASTVPFHRSINNALLRALPNSRSFELAGGHNSPASSPDYFVEVWQSFQSQAALRGGRTSPMSFCARPSGSRTRRTGRAMVQDGALRRQRNGVSVHEAGAVDRRSALDFRESEIENLHAAFGEQMLPGFKSRWTMPFWCAASSASRLCSASSSA